MNKGRIEERYERALGQTHRALRSLPFTLHSPDKVRGLSGWVFEQVLLSSILKELRKKKLRPEVRSQVPLSGRATLDFVLGSVAIEAKVSGTYDTPNDSRRKYQRYRQITERQGLTYFYVTLVEEHEPNVRVAREVFGTNRAFFLDRPGHWNKLIAAIARSLKAKPAVD